MLNGPAKDALLWLYWYPFCGLIQKLGPRPALFVGRLIGRIAFHLCRGKRRQYACELDCICRRDRTLKDRCRILLDAFQIRFQNEMEVLLFPVLTSDIVKQTLPVEGLQHLDHALTRGGGVILLFAHFGANQMIMPAIGYRGYRMCQLSAPPTVWPEKMPNRKFSAIARQALEIRWRHERSLPVEHISVFGSLKPAFRCLKENGILGIAADGGGGDKRVAVPFFRCQMLLSTGAMEIAARTGCAVLPTFMIRNNSGRNTLVIEKALDIEPHRDDLAISRNLTLFAERLEEYVLRQPGHYLDFMALRRMMTSLGDPPFLLDSR